MYVDPDPGEAPGPGPNAFLSPATIPTSLQVEVRRRAGTFLE